MQPLTPTPDQECDIQAMLTNTTGGHLVASELGTGKTLVVVEYVRRLGAQRVLVVCPLGTRIGWERTFNRQGVDLPVRRIESTKAGREAQAAFAAAEPGIFLIGHAMFRRKADLWTRTWDLDVVVYDEVQDVCNRKSQGFKVLKKLKAAQKVAISGTFFGNKFENSWAPARWLWTDLDADTVSGKYVDTSFYRWRAQWCKTEHDPFTFDKIKAVGEKEPGAWNAYLPLYIRTEAKYQTSVVHEDIYVELSRSQRKMYDDLERDALTWLGDNPLVADLPITTRIRLRQATLADLSLSDEGEVYFDPEAKSSKLDALKEFLANRPDDNALIYTDSKRYAKVLAHRLGNSALWDGDTPQAAREQMLTDFGTKFQYLIATISAMGPGVDGLQHVCNTVVWMSQSENQNLNEQALGRLHRTGQTKDVLSVCIKGVDTLDDGVYSRLLATELANRASLRKEATA